jgi:penicillin G amidase
MGKACFITVLVWLVFIGNDVYAQDKQPVTAKGLKERVEVLRDEWGVNHIYAKNTHDLFFAQGYCAAKDRLFQFEIWRRQATGTAAEIFGERELARDIGARLFRYRGDMDKELRHYHAESKAIILDFTAGVNAYIDEALSSPNRLPIEFKLLNIQPGKWTPEVVISRHQGILGNSTEELNIGRAVAKIGDQQVKKLMWLQNGDPVLKMDTAIRADLLSKDILRLYNAFRKDFVFEASDIAGYARNSNAGVNDAVAFQYSQPFPDQPEGSNNWVVGPQRSADGAALLANDPHRKISVPSLRYIVHLSAPGWNVIGGGEPAIPGVAIGHNEQGAWAITVHQTDAEDLYVYDLDPKNLAHYRYKGKWVAMRTVTEMIPVRNSKPVKATLQYTVHGPVCFIDSAAKKAYAMRAAWLEPGAAPYLASLRMDQATDWNSFRDACSYSHIPALNMIWADKKGNIGWQVVGIIPERKNFSGLVPVPGDGRYEWAGFLPIKERPHLLNPAQQFWGTANENLVPDSFAHPDAAGFTWPDAYRADRINEFLGASTTMNLQKMKALQTDYLSHAARELSPLLQWVKGKDSLTEQARRLVLAWDHRMDKSSVAAAIFNKWERELMEQANKKLLPSPVVGLLPVQTTKLSGWLYHPDTFFGDDAFNKRNTFLQQTFDAAIEKLKTQLGDDPAAWQYGQDKYKHIQFIHPLSELVKPEIRLQLNTGSIPRSGYGHTVGATGNMDNQTSGASFRYLATTRDWDETLMINTPGQSGDPASKWYKNLFEMWANDQYFPAYFSRPKIEQHTAEKTILIPGN